MPLLGVNIDHVATLREARGEFEPDVLRAAKLCEKAGADSIVCHLREDRRHINDRDVWALKKSVKARLNLEMSLATKIVAIALKLKPDQATIVPERRQELTTEGGLNVVKYFHRVKSATAQLQSHGIRVNLFIEPDQGQIRMACQAGAEMIELHTGRYANSRTPKERAKELAKIKKMAVFAHKLGLIVNAGHGLKYNNTKPVAAIPEIKELNIGHSIICRAVFVGLEKAIKEMLTLVQ